MEQLKTINISYSLLNDFRNCRKLAYYKYIRGLKPHKGVSYALEYGTLIHKCIDTWHSTYDYNKVLEIIDNSLKHKIDDNPDAKKSYLYARAMMYGYAARWGNQEEFEVVSLEKKFFAPITDIDTLQPIPGVQMTGKVDGIIKIGKEYFLFEHKTAGKLDSNYLDKLWSDFQIILYTYYVNKVFGISCSGVLYNILVKPKIEQIVGETDEEFKIRQMERAASNKLGVSRIKKKIGETDVDYEVRLKETFSDPALYHREKLYISKGLMKRVVTEVSELTNSFMSCVKRKRFYLNTDHCFRYGVPCDYFPICSNNDNNNIIENMYEHYPRYNLDVIDYDGPIL